MSSTHPTETGKSKNVDFCFNWANKICHTKTQGRVTNCGEYFVYFLTDTSRQGGNFRYCAEP